MDPFGSCKSYSKQLPQQISQSKFDTVTCGPINCFTLGEFACVHLAGEVLVWMMCSLTASEVPGTPRQLLCEDLALTVLLAPSVMLFKFPYLKKKKKKKKKVLLILYRTYTVPINKISGSFPPRGHSMPLVLISLTRFRIIPETVHTNFS